MDFHAVFVGGLADGEHKILGERPEHYRFAPVPKATLSGWHPGTFPGPEEVVTIRYENYTLRHFRGASRHGGFEELYFYAVSNMDDGDAFRHLLMSHSRLR